MLPERERAPTPFQPRLSAARKLCVLGMRRTPARMSARLRARWKYAKPAALVPSSSQTEESMAAATISFPARTATYTDPPARGGVVHGAATVSDGRAKPGFPGLKAEMARI